MKMKIVIFMNIKVCVSQLPKLFSQVRSKSPQHFYISLENSSDAIQLCLFLGDISPLWVFHQKQLPCKWKKILFVHNFSLPENPLCEKDFIPFFIPLTDYLSRSAPSLWLFRWFNHYIRNFCCYTHFSNREYSGIESKRFYFRFFLVHIFLRYPGWERI